MLERNNIYLEDISRNKDDNNTSKQLKQSDNIKSFNNLNNNNVNNVAKNNIDNIDSKNNNNYNNIIFHQNKPNICIARDQNNMKQSIGDDHCLGEYISIIKDKESNLNGNSQQSLLENVINNEQNQSYHQNINHNKNDYNKNKVNSFNIGGLSFKDDDDNTNKIIMNNMNSNNYNNKLNNQQIQYINNLDQKTKNKQIINNKNNLLNNNNNNKQSEEDMNIIDYNECQEMQQTLDDKQYVKNNYIQSRGEQYRQSMNFDTQGDEDYLDEEIINNTTKKNNNNNNDDDCCDVDEDDDTSSEFIKELLQNEKKLTQRIYCSEIKALKITKIFNDLIFSVKSELLAYLTLEDICHFKQALQYYLGKSVTKMIDAQILKLIWTYESSNNPLLWDSLINYSFLKNQYPTQYQRHSTTMNHEYDRSIRMDLDRTYPERDEYSLEINQNRLYRVLNGLSFSIKEIGYIQGWNQITGLFLLYPEFPEDMVYWIVTHIMNKIYIKDLYLSIQNAYSTSASESASESKHHQHNNIQDQQQQLDQNKYNNYDDKENDCLDYNKRDNQHQNQMSCSPPIDRKQSSSSLDNQWANSSSAAEQYPIIKLDYLVYTFKIFLKVHMIAVYRQVEKTNYVIYIQKWFTVLFSQQLPPDVTLSILGSIILQDWNYLIKTGLAIFDIYKDEILSKNDPDDIMELFYDRMEITKEQLYHSIQKYEVTNDQMLQTMHLYNESYNDIDNIMLIDGKFYKVEQKQRVEFNYNNNQSNNINCNNNGNNNSNNSSSSSFFERVGNFFLSSNNNSKSESIHYFEEKYEVKYNPIPYGANIDENKFSEIIHFNQCHSKSISKLLIKPLVFQTFNNSNNNDNNNLENNNIHAKNISNNRPFLYEMKTDSIRNQSSHNNNPQNNPSNNNHNNNLPQNINNNNLKVHNNKINQQNNQYYKPFLSNNQLSKEKEFDIVLSYQSQ